MTKYIFVTGGVVSSLGKGIYTGYRSNGYVVVVRRGFLQEGYANICVDFQNSLDNFVNSVKRD